MFSTRLSSFYGSIQPFAKYVPHLSPAPVHVLEFMKDRQALCPDGGLQSNWGDRQLKVDK